jgi:hypothetical protein
MFALVCVGINHQKGGDWKGNRVKPFPNWFWWLNWPTQIIGLTSLFKDYTFYRCQRFNTNQSKEQVRSQKKGAKRKPKAALVWRTGQCLVHQGESTRTLHLRVSQAQLRYNSSDCPVCHRTVSGAPAKQRLSARNGRLWRMNSTAAEVRAAVRGAPDCPVPHEDKASNGRPAQRPIDEVTWRRTGHCPAAHRTVRCAHRQ